jgi:hypothetical protein
MKGADGSSFGEEILKDFFFALGAVDFDKSGADDAGGEEDCCSCCCC